MFFATRIAVVDGMGQLVSVDVPATFETCWLCGGIGKVTPERGDGPDRTCPVCDGHGAVLSVAWDHVEPAVRQGYETLWQPHAWA